MLLRIEQLTKDYGRVRALDRLDLTVAPGEIIGLLGPNGSGKSTALRLLLGFLRPTAGAAWIAGHHCWHDSVAARRCLAYLPGELRLYENMTGRQLVRFLGGLRDRTPASVDELAGALDIDLDRPLAQMSSGMKRKVALIEVLAARAPLLMLDEPTNTLDPTVRDALLDRLRRARAQGQAVLFSSHVLTEVEQVCDRVGILHSGRLVHLQHMAELRQVRRVRARLAHPVEVPEGLPGVRSHEAHADGLTLEHVGPLAPLLDWLARQPVVDLQMEPLGLASIYHRFHGDGA